MAIALSYVQRGNVLQPGREIDPVKRWAFGDYESEQQRRTSSRTIYAVAALPLNLDGAGSFSLSVAAAVPVPVGIDTVPEAASASDDPTPPPTNTRAFCAFAASCCTVLMSVITGNNVAAADAGHYADCYVETYASRPASHRDGHRSGCRQRGHCDRHFCARWNADVQSCRRGWQYAVAISGRAGQRPADGRWNLRP